MASVIPENDKHLVVPYEPVDRGTSRNYGFRDLRARPAEIALVPELQRWPELAELVVAANDGRGDLWSLGCECAVSPHQDPGHPQLRTKVCSYLDLAYAQVGRNAAEDAFDSFVMGIGDFLRGREFSYLVAEYERTPTLFAEHNVFGWCLTVWVAGFGAAPDEARARWRAGIAGLRDYIVFRLTSSVE